MTQRELWVCHLGQVGYAEAAEMQESLRERVIAGELPDLMLLLEHPPVYTLGRRSSPEDLPLSRDWLHEQGIDVVQTPRGGKLTYHAQGQLVGYPIVHVDDVAGYVRAMERALAGALADAGISARGRSAEGREYTGVWVENRKIGSIGVHLSHGVSTHGFALNVDNDMAPWSWVVACGMPDVRMTSMAAGDGDAGHQPAPGGDPRSRGRRQAARGGDRRGRQRLDRDPPDDDPRPELGSPSARRRVVGPVPGDGQAAPRGGGRRVTPELWVCHLGVVDYRDGLALQERICAARQREEVPDVLLLLEHFPVYTRGRRSDADELPMGEEWYRMQGFDIVGTDRGGKLTYHGPGQLVGYPIMPITDVVAYLRTMEAAIVAALAEEGITAGPREGLTGVWVEDRKIGSIGVHVSRGVSTHGFAINVDNDLQPFEWVVPCGLDGVRMTSITKETGQGEHLDCFRRRMALAFCTAFGRRQRLVTPERLEAAAIPSAV